MPPAARVNREMILNAVLDITRKDGFEAVNARSIAVRLNSSTRPIFTCYKNMDELKEDFLAFAYEYYEKYVAEYENSAHTSPPFVLPLSYVRFAREGTCLFRLLFVRDMQMNMTEIKNFYEEPDNEKRARLFAENTGLEVDRARVVFLDLFLYTHGIAVLTAAGKISLDEKAVEQMISNVLSAFLQQEKAGRNAGVQVQKEGTA